MTNKLSAAFHQACLGNIIKNNSGNATGNVRGVPREGRQILNTLFFQLWNHRHTPALSRCVGSDYCNLVLSIWRAWNPNYLSIGSFFSRFGPQLPFRRVEASGACLPWCRGALFRCTGSVAANSGGKEPPIC